MSWICYRWGFFQKLIILLQFICWCFFTVAKTIEIKVVLGMCIFKVHGFKLLCHDFVHHLNCLALK